MATQLRASRKESGSPSSRYIHLDVGGVNYTTSQETLTRYPDSMLGHMFTQEKKPLARDEQGRYLIDRDGVSFRHIQNYLRDGKLSMARSTGEDDQLLAEARFYQLDELVDELSINLNVEGVHYSTTKSILLNHDSPILIPLARDKDGCYVLRNGADGSLFRYILNFLEVGDLQLPERFDKYDQLEHLAKLYELTGIQTVLRVCLVVGGREYVTTRGVLTKIKGTLLEKLFTQSLVPLKNDRQGRYIIDRDGKIFHHILEYLSEGKFNFPPGIFYYDQCQAELEYFELGEHAPPIKIAGNYVSGPQKEYLASWKNLTKYKGSYLEGCFAKAQIGQQKAVMSCNHDVLKYILQFLEDGSVDHVPNSVYSRLRQQARNFELPDLVRSLSNN